MLFFESLKCCLKMSVCSLSFAIDAKTGMRIGIHWTDAAAARRAV